MSWSIAPIAVDDADEVGRVHVRVWQEAYAGLMPADYLESLDPVAFAAHWRRVFADPRPGAHTWVARERTDGERSGIVGLATSGPARDEDPPTSHELYAINVLARAHGTGVGRALLEHAIGDRAAYLWVLDGNARATAFYRRHRFADDGGRKPEPNTGLVEIRMSRGAVGGSA